MKKQTKPQAGKPAAAKRDESKAGVRVVRVAKAKPEERQKIRDMAASPHDAPFPIVGIGASAGGLEALEAFLGHVPEDCGLAFVIVQHLDPTHKGIMVELLQRITKMKVVQVKDRMAVEPDKVYVIPPDKDMSILHGVLHLLVPVAPRGMRLPIDYFFRSLAEDRQGNCVGVILSGMGSDGTLGLSAIKEKAGAVFVQDPQTAKFDAMPRSAIDAGLADLVAPAEDLAARIVAFLRRDRLMIAQNRPWPEKELSGLEKVLVLLREQTGTDFSLYKRNTVYRRIERRMGINQVTKITDYIRFLRENPQEGHLLFKELLIGVTSFFREPAVWEQMKKVAIPELLEARPSRTVVRAWTPGCSTGEEAYSLAIVFREALEKLKPTKEISLQIFATDLDKDAIDRARQGFYAPNIAADVSEERLHKFFIEEEHGYRVGREIREMVVFAPQNLLTDPPFTKIDILTCRNLLIYLAPELQRKIIPLFHYSLNPGGILLLGNAETIGNATDLFTAFPGKTQTYRRLEGTRAEPLELPSPAIVLRGRRGPLSSQQLETKPAASLQTLVEQTLLQHYGPSAVVTTEKGDILYISGRTGKFLEPAAGKANWNVLAMAREGLRLSLGSAFQKAVREKETVTLDGVRMGTNGDTHEATVTIVSLGEPEPLRGKVLIVFSEHPAVAASDAPAASPRRHVATLRRVEQLERELRYSRDEVRTTREEMQSSQEELKSANEELQSTNEELQSSNEELTTSKEEMQSMNEELHTVNQELRAKVEDLSRASNDMKNLLNSTDIATLFLDDVLRIRRFTPAAASIIKLIPADEGRPITDIVSTLEYPGMVDDVREVLRTLLPTEKQIPARDGKWFTVRTMPYRTNDNRIDGVVITFINITLSKHLEDECRSVKAELAKYAGEDGRESRVPPRSPAKKTVGKKEKAR